ncbi:hypothetical protein SD77_2741 [Bacillus badius]|uniref:Uncharacterized protein n=1 Tax=Bacillus badius TaxID=1455 RepID=A0ABR5APM9_BACBA|nr:hypothetical protein SD77_2741 [Bacillus badius]
MAALLLSRLSMSLTMAVIAFMTAMLFLNSSASRMANISSAVIVFYDRFIYFSFSYWVKVFVSNHMSVDVNNFSWMNMFDCLIVSCSVNNCFGWAYYDILVMMVSAMTSSIAVKKHKIHLPFCLLYFMQHKRTCLRQINQFIKLFFWPLIHLIHRRKKIDSKHPFPTKGDCHFARGVSAAVTNTVISQSKTGET